MPSKKKGNITLTHRKSRSRQRYRHSGTKKPSRMEKQSVSKSSKRNKDKDPVICTPKEPDSSEFENKLPSTKINPTIPKPKPRKLQDDLNSQLPPGKKEFKTQITTPFAVNFKICRKQQIQFDQIVVGIAV
jgi:hypothetical protein